MSSDQPRHHSVCFRSIRVIPLSLIIGMLCAILWTLIQIRDEITSENGLTSEERIAIALNLLCTVTALWIFYYLGSLTEELAIALGLGLASFTDRLHSPIAVWIRSVLSRLGEEMFYIV